MVWRFDAREGLRQSPCALFGMCGSRSTYRLVVDGACISVVRPDEGQIAVGFDETPLNLLDGQNACLVHLRQDFIGSNRCESKCKRGASHQ